MQFKTLSNLVAELSLRTTWHVARHVACDKRLMCCTWLAHDCAGATWAYVVETQRSEEIVKNLELRLWTRLLLLLLLLTNKQAPRHARSGDTSDVHTVTLLAVLPGVRHGRVIAGLVGPVSVDWGWCATSVSVWQQTVEEDLFLRCASYVGEGFFSATKTH